MIAYKTYFSIVITLYSVDCTDVKMGGKAAFSSEFIACIEIILSL